MTSTTCVESDALALEIARLEAELGGMGDSTDQPAEQQQEQQKPSSPLKRFGSQRDYVVMDGSFAVRDVVGQHNAATTTAPSLIQSSSLLSYDEVTVTTQDMMNAGGGVVLQQQQQPSLLGPIVVTTPAHVLYPSYSNSQQHQDDDNDESYYYDKAEQQAVSLDATFMGTTPNGKPDVVVAKPKASTTRKVKKKVSVRKKVKKKPSTNHLDDEAARLQAEIDKMEAELAAAAAAAAQETTTGAAVQEQCVEKGPTAGPQQQQPEIQPSSSTTNSMSIAAPLAPSSASYDNHQQVATTPVVGGENHSTTDELDEIQKLEAEIKKLEVEMSGGGTRRDPPSGTIASNEKEKTAPPPPNPMLGLLGAIQVAATDRKQRLDDGGEQIMQDVAPEVEAKQTGPMQLSTSMAEMISQRAAARDKRLADGGEKKMRKVVIKEKEEYQKDFSDIVSEAASMGRLTRLNEHVVEATAIEKTPEQEWKSNGLLAIQWRSNHMAVIHEAANMGNQCKLPEEIVSNCPDEEQRFDLNDPQQMMSERKKQLLEVNSTVGQGQQKVDKLLMYLKDEQPTEHLLIKPMDAYANIEEVKLPKQAPPKVDPARNAERLSKMKQEALRSGRPMIDISVTVAERAWERRARLDRPGALPKILEKCSCPYCGSASPYQTAAYRKLEHDRRHGHRGHGEQLHEAEVHDDIERKRLERRRMREESRRLKKELSQASSCVAVERVVEESAAIEQPVENPIKEETIEETPKRSGTVPVPPEPEAACCACSIM